MFIREKKKFYQLIIINRTVIKQNKKIVRHETVLIRVIIKQYTEEINLDIIKINNYQIIFGIP
jgi:hypothetical protein